MAFMKGHPPAGGIHPRQNEKVNWAIWGFAFGYFAFYVPYSATAKALSKGLFGSMEEGVRGFSILPLSVMASIVVMVAFMVVTGWWRDATRVEVLGFSVPRPTRFTFASGVCTSLIIATTTLAYTFDGVSIVFVMLLLRGGVLSIAPIVDRLSHRKTNWHSWLGLGFSFLALLIAFSEQGGYEITVLCAIDVGVYILSYFTRLRVMSSRAKSNDPKATRRYFVEEQIVAGPFLLLVLGAVALVGEGTIVEDLRWGFVDVWDSSVVAMVALVGVFSQGTGICGTLIFLDKREITYCVPVNRCSSILAGLCASYALYAVFDQQAPSLYKLAGAGCILLAILSLTVLPAFVARKGALRSRVRSAEPKPGPLGAG